MSKLSKAIQRLEEELADISIPWGTDLRYDSNGDLIADSTPFPSKHIDVNPDLEYTIDIETQAIMRLLSKVCSCISSNSIMKN